MHPRLVVLLVVAACSSQGEDPPVDAAITHPPVDSHVATPDAPPVATQTTCASKDPVVQLIYTCDFQWKQCTGTSTADHEISCTIQSAGTLKFSLCNCMVGGASQMQFTSTTICGLGTWPDLEAAANMQCNWNLH